MIENLVGRVFATRNFAHVSHWRTKSFSAHEALGAFYDDVIDALDALVECHQAVNGLVGAIPSPGRPSGDAVEHLTKEAEWIEKNHEAICGGNRAIGNKIDELTAVYLRTIYKLKNLK